MRHVQRLGLLAGFAVLLMMVGSASVSAQSNQISGVGVFDTTGTTCSGPPEGYADYLSYPPIVLNGSLKGCWYTKIDTIKDHGAPSGIYLESRSSAEVEHTNGLKRACEQDFCRFRRVRLVCLQTAVSRRPG